jgi:hypothetical protein
MHQRDLTNDTPTLLVRPWVDPVIDQVGYDPRSVYVERFWLGILGPSATWLMRYLVDRLEADPDGHHLDLHECASSLGLGRRQGPNAAFPRTITRCCQFGAGRFAGQHDGRPVLEVRRKLPPLTRRQIARLPDALRADHDRWIDRSPAAAAADLRDQARRLALSLIELGEDSESTERQLHRWRFHPALASEATAWALAQRRGPGDQPVPHRDAVVDPHDP